MSGQSIQASLFNFKRYYALGASQAAWYRLGNRPKAENGRKLAEKCKMVQGPKWRKKGPKMAKKSPKPSLPPFLGHFFPISGRGPFFYFSANFFPF